MNDSLFHLQSIISLYRIVPLNISAILQVGNGQPGFFLNFTDDGSNNRFPRLNVSAGESQSRPRIRRLGQPFLHQNAPLRIHYHTHIAKFSFHLSHQMFSMFCQQLLRRQKFNRHCNSFPVQSLKLLFECFIRIMFFQRRSKYQAIIFIKGN